MSELSEGVLLVVLGHVAPGQDVRGARKVAGQASRNISVPFRNVRKRKRLGGGHRRHRDQALSRLQRAHRERHRLRADDVQALQARLLLVLPGVAGCKNPSKFKCPACRSKNRVQISN